MAMSKIKLFCLSFVFSTGLLAAGITSLANASVPEEPFDSWLSQMRQEAIAEGISENLVNLALSNIEPVERVIELDRKQPEGQWTFAQYREKIVHPYRIKRGREMLRKHRAELEGISRQTGVAPQYIVALWGIETNYGQNTGGFNVIPALATLAWEGRRADFFRKELLNALKIIDEGHIELDEMSGSWAGAMGQNQFMPSSFKSYAVDGDHDGRKDIWNNLSDVFASTANYLVRSGWNAGERWGREVILPDGFSESEVDLKKSRPLSEWRDLGLKTAGGNPIPVVDGMDASVVAPDGIGGPAYLVYNNYKTIMRWNRSTYFATSVGLLANAIAN